MRLSQMLNVIDSHTAGEPARIVVGGIPVLKGKTVAEKKQYLIDHRGEQETIDENGQPMTVPVLGLE